MPLRKRILTTVKEDGVARIVFDVDLAVEPERVIEALDTEAGIRGWWTDDASVPGGIGSEMTVGFPIAPARFRLQVEQVSPRRVVWRSVGEFPPHWANTTISWSLGDSPSGHGGVSLRFVHDGWANDEGPFGNAALTWGRLMDRLKRYCETGVAEPLFLKAG
jgi:uncharacterized protein YndB with AHSA1/START domain